MRRHDPDLDHHGTLFAWPDWVLRMIERTRRRPTPQQWSAAHARFDESFAAGMALPESVLTDAQLRELHLLTDVDRVKWQMHQQFEIMTAEREARQDPYAWFDPKQAMGR